MKMLDLFSGIGGFSLAAEWTWGKELEIVGFVENNKYCQKVLSKQWGNIPIYSDICDFTDVALGRIDLITGGFPCQDISIAGKGEGIGGKRSGLWTEFKRVISEVRPRFALIENVPMLIHRGLGRVLCDLAEIGYDAEWQCISASEVGAWHKRERIWIVAYPNKIDSNTRYDDAHRQGNEEGIQGGSKSFFESDSLDKIVSDPNKKRLQGCKEKRNIMGKGKNRNQLPARQSGNRFDYWATEPELGRVAHGIPDRVDRLKSPGNAIVPQVAYIIMQQIKRAIKNKWN